MDENFITGGIENDRYLKAVRLVERFETELTRKIQNLSEETTSRRPGLFDEHRSWARRTNKSRNRTTPLGHIRVDSKMNRMNGDGERLKLSISIEWAQPEVHRHEEPADGALCIALYKIKRLTKTTMSM